MDSGSACNLMSKDTYEQLNPKPQLKPTAFAGEGFNQQIVSAVGEIDVLVGLVNEKLNQTYSKVIKLFVMPQLSSPVILSRQGMKHAVHSLDMQFGIPVWKETECPDGMQPIDKDAMQRSDFARPSSW